jgi:RNA polymerase sigma factor (sigma-70 family)
METNDIENLSEKGKQDFLLVRRALDNKDQSAYAELMHRYKDSIYFMLLKMVNNKDDADDLTIEAFGKAFKRLDQYTPNYAFSTWLFKIASNNCIDFIRKQRMKMYSIDKSFEDDEGSELTMDLKCIDLDPEEAVIRDQKIILMRNLVDQLKPRYRELIELRYFKELSYEEISEELDLPLGTVKAQLFRARDFLFHIVKNSKDNI